MKTIVVNLLKSLGREALLYVLREIVKLLESKHNVTKSELSIIVNKQNYEQ